MGAMTRGELSVLETPSMGHVLEHVVGMGAVAINIGLVASLVGTLIGWFYLFLKFLMWQEKMAYFRKSLRKQIKANTAHGIMDFKWCCPNYIYHRFVSESTYQIMYFIASTSILLPYLLSALFQFKLVITNELKDAKLKTER